MLKLPNFEKSFHVRTDASETGLGSILMQEYDGELFPICYASKKLTEQERRYSTMERECLAIVWSLKKFEKYLYGKLFILETDHNTLQYLEKAKFVNARMMRWALILQ